MNELSGDERDDLARCEAVDGDGSAGMGSVIRYVPVDRIIVPEGRRPPRDVERLADSVREVGLLNPIVVTKSLRLVAGGNRLAAFKRLGRTEIRANVVELDDVDAELAEIDENLIRNELTVLERGEQLARRQEIYEEKHPKTKHGGDRRSEEARSSGNDFHLKSFADDTASQVGTTARTVRQEVQIARKITPAARDLIRGTGLADHKTELLSLARVPPEEQVAAVRMILDGQANTVARARRAVDRLPRDGPPGGGSSVPGGADAAAALASRYRIIHGDCRRPLVDLGVDPEAVDAVVTDPPYGINYRHSGRGSATRPGRPANRHAEATEGDDQPFDPSRWLELGCPCLFVGAQNFAHLLPPGGSWLQWDKACGKGPHDSFLDGELVWCSVRGIKRNVIRVLWKGVVCVKRGEDNGKRYHPNQKPIRLMRRCIRRMRLPPDSLIVEPYMGSGSTLIAALLEGHRCVGIEIDPRHCARARDRIERRIKRWIERFHQDPGRLPAALRRALSAALEADVK